MKNSIFILLLTTSTLFISCDKDEVEIDEEVNLKEQLMGSWEITYKGIVSGDNDLVRKYENQAPECGLDYMQFNSDNSGADHKYYMDTECGTHIETFTYELDGYNFNIDFANEDMMKGIIDYVNDTSLKIYFTPSENLPQFKSILIMTKL